MYRLSEQCISSLDKTYRADSMILNDYDVTNITKKPKKNTCNTWRKSEMQYEKHDHNSKRKLADHYMALSFYQDIL